MKPLIRWVQLHIDPLKTDEFLDLFQGSKESIRSFPGCQYMALLEGTSAGEFFTLSVWESQEFLEKYRSSPLFSDLWGSVKATFCAPAQALTTYPKDTPSDYAFPSL